MRVLAVDDIRDFVGLPGDPSDYGDQVVSLWESGESRPEWCFVLEEDGKAIGRIGLRVADTAIPGLCPELPPTELYAFGLHLPWEQDFIDRGRYLLGTALDRGGGEFPELFQLRVNREVHRFAEARCRLAEACGMTLLQEKQGVWWEDEGVAVTVPDRLQYRSLKEVPHDEYARVMGRCQEGTIDRNDRYYWLGCGPDDWGWVMMSYLSDDDAGMWLLAYAGDEPVGYVAVSAVDDWGSTIAHIGVLPAHRGNGYINDLLAAGTAAAQRAGIKSMLSDADVLNRPMLDAFRRAGHRDDARPWHAWFYWASVAEVIEACTKQRG